MYCISMSRYASNSSKSNSKQKVILTKQTSYQKKKYEGGDTVAYA